MKINLIQYFSTCPKITRLLAISALVVASLLPGVVSSQPVSQQRRLTLESFEFVGNSKTQKNTIQRSIGLSRGDEITPEIIELSRQRLEHTNFFKEVSVYARPGTSKGKIVLIVEVKERYWPYFQFGGGHNGLEGWYFIPASLRFDNMSGRGSRLGLKWQLGDRHSRLSLGFATTIGSTVRFNIELFGSETDYIHYLKRSQDSSILQASQPVTHGGLKIRLSGVRGFFQHFFAGFRIENYDPNDFATRDDGVQIDSVSLPVGIADDLVEKEFRTLEFGLRLDTRDNVVYPQKGLWGSATVELANERQAANRIYAKLTADLRIYQKVTTGTVFALHAKAGYVSEDSPFYQRFYLGGGNSLRGYHERRLTPIGWGTKLVLTNVEFRFPITRKRFPYHKSTGVLFFDTGGIWQTGQTPKFEDIFAAIGFGFRIKLPVIGITRLDFAFPLNKIDDNHYKFHLSLGHTF